MLHTIIKDHYTTSRHTHPSVEAIGVTLEGARNSEHCVGVEHDAQGILYTHYVWQYTHPVASSPGYDCRV